MTVPLQRPPDAIISERDFSKFVAETYGRPFRLQQLWMQGNDTFLNVEVYDRSKLDEGTEAEAAAAIADWQRQWELLSAEPQDWPGRNEMMAEREHNIDIEVLLIDLHARDLIPVGNYIMLVSW